MKSSNGLKSVVSNGRNHEHHYPFFQRWYDDYSLSGKMIERHCYCFRCNKEFVIRLNPSHMVIEHIQLGKEKNRETVSKLRKNLPKVIRQWKERVKKYGGARTSSQH